MFATWGATPKAQRAIEAEFRCGLRTADLGGEARGRPYGVWGMGKSQYLELRIYTC